MRSDREGVLTEETRDQKMSAGLIGWLLIFLPCVCDCVTFKTSGPKVVTKSSTVEFTCSQDDKNLYVMLWYQQVDGKMDLIGHSYVGSEAAYEERFKTRFEITRENIENGGLVIRSAETGDSAVYFCAASTQFSSRDRFYLQSCISVNSNPAYFGSGTKLTVLEHNISEPQIQIFTPAEKECQASSQRKAWKKTLVCVASGFYPDTVEVTWDIDGTRATRNVATDSLAQREEEGSHKYRITSRLMVEAQTWARAGIKYTCAVSFYNGTQQSVKKVTQENPSPNKVPNTVRFQRLSQGAKLSYVTLIVKSAVYGAFVVVLLWKLKGSGSVH
ncbi:M1-specific T cell receptor beta chain-like [Synchiropus splendidus]|uniref:M1-specific T cell receptor beta chain-like n=1 Tax=Synchiropus splendidus TaxID=270530 RepID=UPI00237EAA5B|nr:M1-specific T cell receptor beta chain-like [Synchiropus splendidus]